MEDFMRLLAIGDVCSTVGIDTVKKYLPVLKKEKNNGKNKKRNNFKIKLDI